MRKGISFTLTVVVVAVVVLVSALTLLVLQGDYLSSLGQWIMGETDSGFDRIEKQQIRSGCRNKMENICGTVATGGCPSDFVGELDDSQYWVCNVEFEGVDCYKAWEENPSSVPEC